MSSLGLKLEIVYFCTPADAYLEFGVRSYYPMRTLSSSCNDFQDYLFALKKAVARNQIVLVVGGFGKHASIAEVTGLAVGRKMIPFVAPETTVDPPERLPQGSKPLYEGNNFVGLILESGEQSIILLSERYPDRIRLVRNLIAPYLTEKYRDILEKAINKKGN